MATQIVMDYTGDSRFEFDPSHTAELAEAEKRFKSLLRSGFTAAVRTAAGESRKISSFEPGAEETLFVPRLVGG